MKKYVTLGSAATVTALCFIVLMFACQKESSLIPATAARSDEKYLEFKDKDEFDKTVKDLAKKSRQELDAWDKANNFVSLRGLYEQIIDEENATAEKEDALIKANPNLKSTMKHQYSSLLDDCKQMISYNNAGIDMNLFEPQYAKVLNKDGVVKIGTSLYQFGADNYKVVVDADYANVKNLLTVSKDNQTDNMKYFPVRVSNQLLKNGRPNNSGSCQSDNNSFRLEATAYSYYFYQPNIYSGDFYNKVVLGIKMKFTRDHWYGRTNFFWILCLRNMGLQHLLNSSSYSFKWWAI